MFARAGMRKSVNLGLEYFLFSVVAAPTLLLALSIIAVVYVIPTTSFGFYYLNVLFYALNVIS